ncbi:MAG: class I SAM-dependent methyltransferase [Verrucomicrobiia bacterium]
MANPHDQNRQTWDRLAREEYPLARAVGEKEIKNPAFITNPWGWIGKDVKGKRVLCLAAGGGKHSVLFALAGADTTVVDISPEMLELDRREASERGLKMRILEASMDNLSALESDQFDIVIQPVSSCYVPDLLTVYREVARVLKADGIYVCQHKQPQSLQTGLRPIGVGYVVQERYYRSGPLPQISGVNPVREEGAQEFLHRWDDLLGGLCKNGFMIEDVAEPRHADFSAAAGTFKHRSCYLPPYIAVKARRRADYVSDDNRIILPS